MCTVPLPPGVYPIAVDKYINIKFNINIPDVVLIQLILLIISTLVLETCTDLVQTYTKRKLCVKLVVYKIIRRCMVKQNVKCHKSSRPAEEQRHSHPFLCEVVKYGTPRLKIFNLC